MDRLPRLRQRCLAAGGGALFFILVVASCSSAASDSEQSRYFRPFRANSVWNAPIVADPTIDAQSNDMVGLLDKGHWSAALVKFGIPIYDADENTKFATVRCTREWIPPCGVEGQVRIPADARPHEGSDHAMVVVDWTTNTAYEFWDAHRIREPDANGEGAVWETGWGAKTKDVLEGNGIGANSAIEFGAVEGHATASKMSRLGGVVRLREIADDDQEIDHALALASAYSCANKHRFPAAKEDGDSQDRDCIPQGSRVQLDPSIDVDAIEGISSAERKVAKALQKYGGYILDRSGEALVVSFEVTAETIADERVPSQYVSHGLGWDYHHMPKIPIERLRVLATWNGAPLAASGLSAKVAGSDVTLEWSASSDATKYHIWRAPAGSGEWERIGEVSAPTATYVDTPPAASYDYAIRAADTAGNVAESSNVVAVTVS